MPTFIFFLLLCLSFNAFAYKLTPAFGALQFKQPLQLSQIQNDPQRWFVLEQQGVIRSFKTGDTKSTVVLDIGDRVESGGEKGLLGMAFHPRFPETKELFVSYTGKIKGELTSIVSRFSIDPRSLQADPRSEKRIITVEQPYSNHNGGQISFGPDGFLYISWGDGGWAGDPKNNGQNTQTLLGALLRLDVNTHPYTTPKDNPFIGNPEKGRPEIYAYGLRNPWRWSFDRKTGELWMADVGQNAWEEINIVKKGGNYGWPLREGTHCYRNDPCLDSKLIDPIHEYDHAQGQSITGGYVYRGNKLGQLQGQYIFGDFVSGKIWSLTIERNKTQVQRVLDTTLNIASFAEDLSGEVYVLSYGDGLIYRIDP
ncbi:MAG: PQQ-dependent sugar dehydrogenase [Gammaproteobacteria bacterium]|nr:PQQ-dependent sugar dehydrogenase [Gammaproteobacteria bacterium]MDH5692603.1 PQQ-dependent sugar dehydrogenase [Gammaproteobacteria bacterium]